MRASVHTLWCALDTVKTDAQMTKRKYEAIAQEQPIYGWPQDKHDQYCKDRIAEADTVETWCLVRQMQIDPD